MFLVDTNIFLEILLGQRKKEEAKKFLSENIGRLYITDFSLHSIGVILFKLKKPKVFEAKKSKRTKRHCSHHVYRRKR